MIIILLFYKWVSAVHHQLVFNIKDLQLLNLKQKKNMILKGLLLKLMAIIEDKSFVKI